MQIDKIGKQLLTAAPELEQAVGAKLLRSAEALIGSLKGPDYPEKLISSSAANSAIPAVSAIDRPLVDGTFSVSQLKVLGTPQGLTNSPFARFHDLSLFERHGDRVPVGRYGQKNFVGNEDYFLEAINRRFLSGEIDASTLVVDETGHGMTIGYAMAQRFRAPTYANLHSDIFSRGHETVNLSRVFGQAQTFFEPTKRALGNGVEHPAAALLSHDGHASVDISKEAIQSLPSVETLKAIGIKKVFYPMERTPTETLPIDKVSFKNMTGLRHWLKSLRDSGMDVKADGIDIRPHLSPRYGPFVFKFDSPLR